MADAHVTPASGWKRTEAEPFTLPSGNVALLRKPQMMAMLGRGEVPNPLIGVALDMLDGKVSRDPAKSIELIDFLVAQAFVKPRVLLNGAAPSGDDELPVAALEDADKVAVLEWLQPSRKLEPFRGGDASADGGADGGDVRHPSE